MARQSNHQHAPNLATAADQARTRATAAGRWYGGFLTVIGVFAVAYIVALETMSQGFFWRIVTGVAWFAFMLLAAWWAERHAVYPRRASRYLWISVAIWFGMYLLLLGPLVRWKFDDSLLPWALASLVMALPFFVSAGLISRR